jgi:flagellar hook assembly protein FlgD
LIRAIVDYAAVEDSHDNGMLSLKQNFPNPVIGATTIAYVLPEATKVKLEIYDVTGSLIRILSNEIQPTGAKQVMWDRRCRNGKAVRSGTYFYTLTVGNRSFTKAITVL